MKYLVLSVIAGISLMMGCTVEPDPQDMSGIFQYNVEITSTITDNKHPIPHGDEMLVTVSVTPKDYAGDPINFPAKVEGDQKIETYFALELRPTNGEIEPSEDLDDELQRRSLYRYELESYDGVKTKLLLWPADGGDKLTASFYLKHTYGQVRIFAKGYMVTYSDYERRITGVQALNATGSSRVLNFQDLTIHDTQLYEKAYTGQTVHLEGDNLHVIETTGTGMYLVDIDLSLMGKENLTTEEQTRYDQQYCMLENGTLNPNFVGYNAMFIYSHNAPENYTGEGSVGADEEAFEAVQAGDKVNWITGNISEFLEMTEISFPVWKMDESIKEANPEATEEQIKELQKAKRAEIVEKLEKQVCVIGDNLTYYPGGKVKSNSGIDYSSGAAVANLERFESNVITITDLVIGDFDPDNRDYKQYSQWQVIAGKCEGGSQSNLWDTCPRFRVVSRDNAAEFDALFAAGTVKKGTHLKSVTGVLHQVYDETWVLYARSCRDLILDSGEDACTAVNNE